MLIATVAGVFLGHFDAEAGQALKLLSDLSIKLVKTIIAQATGAGLSLSEQVLLLSAATLSIVPSVPIADMALILDVDRFMSECRSLTSFIGNAVATIVVSRWKGAFDNTQFDTATAGKLPSVDQLPAEMVAAE